MDLFKLALAPLHAALPPWAVPATDEQLAGDAQRVCHYVRQLTWADSGGFAEDMSSFAARYPGRHCREDPI